MINIIEFLGTIKYFNTNMYLLNKYNILLYIISIWQLFKI